MARLGVEEFARELAAVPARARAGRCWRDWEVAHADGRAATPSLSDLASEFPATLDLSELGSDEGFIITGDYAGDRAGRAVASAGDVNGDGFDDVIVGARGGDDGGFGAGEAYVLFGGAGGFGAIDLGALAPAQGFKIQGDSAGDEAGFSVAGAGDVNGDGFADVIVGAHRGDDGGLDAGEAYVVFGKATALGTIDLTGLASRPGDGFIIQGEEGQTPYQYQDTGDFAGRSVASAGDLNGDGFDDVVVGATRAANNGGSVYVVFGKAAGFGTIDLSALAPADGFIARGTSASFEGFSVASAGDVNRDGFDDMFLGAPGNDTSFVIFGGAGPFGVIDGSGRSILDLNTLAPTSGFVVKGPGAAYTGASVSSVGDVNGDGFDDIIVGAPRASNAYGQTGEAYVVFGKAGGFGAIDGMGRAVVDLTTLVASDGFAIIGNSDGDRAGYCVSAAGDINGDGFDDIIVGAPYRDGIGGNSGEAYVIYGKAGGFGTIDVTALDGENGFTLSSDTAGEAVGFGVSSAGDINRDGFDDLIIGAPLGLEEGGAQSGEAYVLFGRAPIEAVSRVGAAGDQVIRGGDFNDTLSGLAGADTLIGDLGKDRLKGGKGLDRLKGGGGKDRFILDSDLAKHADTILDFQEGKDKIALSAAVYGLPEGALAPGRFVLGNQAQDANDRLIYKANGKLYFDPDGTGAQAQVLIATLTGAPALGAGDFVVI